MDKVNEDIRSGSIFKGIEISECESGALKESLTMQELAIIKAYRNADFDHKRIALIALYDELERLQKRSRFTLLK